jgi:hypothetical protein
MQPYLLNTFIIDFMNIYSKPSFSIFKYIYTTTSVFITPNLQNITRPNKSDGSATNWQSNQIGADGKMHYNPGWEPGSMKTLAAHGLAGGIGQDRMGGSFGAGFLAGSVGSYFGSSGKSSKANEMIGNTAIEAVIGGTISMIGGGKFANGAHYRLFITFYNTKINIFLYRFNEWTHHGRAFSNSRKFKTQLFHLISFIYSIPKAITSKQP